MEGGKAKRLLIVEDEVIIARWTRLMLEKQDYTVETVYRGEDAVSFVEEGNDVSLILMDMDLGSGINGMQAAEIIRNIKQLPIVFYTNHKKEDLFSTAGCSGDFGYVNKYSSKDYLFRTIEEYLYETVSV